MRRRKLIVKIAGICSIAALGLAVLFMTPTTALGQSVGVYGVSYYRHVGPEPKPRWQNDLPGVDNKLNVFRHKMVDDLGATIAQLYTGSSVSRSNIQARYSTGFDRYNMVYWQGHSHTLPFNMPADGDENWWHDPPNLLHWGTPSVPYLPGGAESWNPSWFAYPCANNPGPGYTAANSHYWRTTSFPMWNGYYGRHAGEAVLTRCDLSRHNGNGLGQNNNKWLILDSCDAVRVAYHSPPFNSMDHGVISWDQTFDGMHGVMGHFASILYDEHKADYFAAYLEQGETIFYAYHQASNNPHAPSLENRMTSVITAENKPRIWWCFQGFYCMWIYPYWDVMAITDHWYGFGTVSDDIDWQDIEYFYTAFYIPN